MSAQYRRKRSDPVEDDIIVEIENPAPDPAEQEILAQLAAVQGLDPHQLNLLAQAIRLEISLGGHLPTFLDAAGHLSRPPFPSFSPPRKVL